MNPGSDNSILRNRAKGEDKVEDMFLPRPPFVEIIVWITTSRVSLM